MLEAFALFKKHFGFIAWVTLVCYLPYSLCELFVSKIGYESDTKERALLFFGQLVFLGILECAAHSLAAGSITCLLLKEKQGVPVDGRTAFREGLRQWRCILGSLLVAEFFILLGIFALIVPGIYLCVRYSLLIPVVVAEGDLKENPRARSAQLVAGHGWEIFGTIAIVLLPLSILGKSVEGYSPGFVHPASSFVFSTLSILTNRFLDVSFFLYYWNIVSSRKREQEISTDILAYDAAPPEDISG